MSFHPTTQRLILRPPMLTDTPAFVAILNDFDVARNLAPVPHPYTESLHRERIAADAAERQAGTAYRFAVTRAMDGALIGLCGLERQPDGAWDFGYWYGKPYWGQGYASEAARPVLRFAFDDLGAAKVTAGWFEDNWPSGRVLEKLGFTLCGKAERHSAARGTHVMTNRVELTRDRFVRMKAA